MEKLHHLVLSVIDVSTVVLASLILLGIAAIAVIFILDITQTKQAIRRNYPVIGRLRYLFEHLGVFSASTFSPWTARSCPLTAPSARRVVRSAKNVDPTLAFGSTKPINQPGTILFLNSMFPKLDEEANLEKHEPIVFGAGFAEEPYTTYSVFHISAMSYGALSAPAIKALSTGAKNAGILLNTGEGGLAPYHLEGGCDLVFQIGTAKYGVRNEHGELCDTKLRELAVTSR